MCERKKSMYRYLEHRLELCSVKIIEAETYDKAQDEEQIAGCCVHEMEKGE